MKDWQIFLLGGGIGGILAIVWEIQKQMTALHKKIDNLWARQSRILEKFDID